MATPPRKYYSPRRQQQADETRRKIVEAARRLLEKRGYGETRIADIAQEAGVAVQTVYAIFGSKQGILAGLIDRAAFGLEYDKLIEAWEHGSVPAERLRYAAKIACQIFEAERAELDFLRRAGVPSPESAIDRDRDARFTAQATMIRYLKSQNALRPGLTAAAAHDILWTLTAREVFLALTVERGWSAARYRQWLADLLVRELLGIEEPAKARLRARRASALAAS